MKKVTLSFVLAITFILVMTVVVMAEEADLMAGQHTKVGVVSVTNDADNLYVSYQITEPGWGITETHLSVRCLLEDIPQTEENKKGLGGGNPIPGHFEYSMEHDPSVTEYTYVVPIPECDDEVVIAAHAVVEKEGECSSIMYGTSLGGSGVGDRIHEIDVFSLTSTELFDTALSPSSVNGPNGNAYDSVNNRFYYSRYSGSDHLYFYDFTTAVNNPSGSLPGGSVACAGWYNGKYYYIPQNSKSLYEVTFNPDGTIATKTIVHTYASSLGSFGDIVVSSSGLIYGSSSIGGVGKFWSIDLNSPSYTFTEISSMPHMQLAFGSDGTLYGHDANAGDFYEIDPIAGTRTLIGTIGSQKFTDLASGPYEPCTPQEETAWAEGLDFPGKNWATYFTYTPQELVTECFNIVSDNGVDWSSDGETWYDAVPCGVHSSWNDVDGATWIWRSEYTDVLWEYNNVPGGGWYFKKEFDIPGEPFSGEITINVDNTYSLSVNGDFVGSEGSMDKIGPDYHEWDTLDTYDILGNLEEGTNTILVRALNFFNTGSSTSNPAGLAFNAEICYSHY